MNHSGTTAVFFVQLAQLLLPVDIGFIKSVHGSAAQVVASITEIAGSAALA
jgi:hypothetical protein